MISLRNVSKVYEVSDQVQFTALTNISIDIKDGDIVSLIGPSGCGKSTLMHIIGLLDKPTTGRVELNGMDVSKLNDTELSKMRSEVVGFVFQQFNLINKLTVLENVLLPTMYSRTPLPYDATKRALELLSQFGLADKAKSYPNKISGGQQQRTAIARALIMSPRLILADEPTGNLDTKTGKEILDLLVELNRKEHMTVVIVTHDPTVAKRARRAIKLKDGKLI